MKNVPEKIYLLVEDENIDFSESKGGVASTTRVNKNDLIYIRSDRSQFVYLIVGISNNIVYGCFKKQSSAERFIGNSNRYDIKKIKVE